MAKTATSKRKPTIAAGASIERELVKRHLEAATIGIVQEMRDAYGDEHLRLQGYRHALEDISNWLKRQPARVAKRQGGTGRR